MKVNLIYLSPWNVGGFATFTAHMFHALRVEQWDVSVLRCNKDKSEGTERTMKHHGIIYRNVSVAEAVKAAKKTPTLITAVARPDDLADKSTIKKLIKAGAYVFVQSTQEFKQFPHVEDLRSNGSQVLVIRERLKSYFKGSRYIPHPYVRHRFGTPNKEQWLERKRACSIAMVATNKHPKMICEVNESLPKNKRIVLLGKETTHFLRKGLMDKYPKYKPGIGFVGSAQAVELAQRFKINVDLSAYDGDGGGTQYSFLEAMDAGCINILHKDWLAEKGDMIEGVNCYGVDDAASLESYIRDLRWQDYANISKHVEATLDAHSSDAIVKKLRRLV